jgi:two-component system, OmpR family, sensor kinase
MRSIHRQLLGALLVSVVIAAAIAGAAVYYQARQEAGEILDYQLRQMALSLRDQTVLGPAAPRPPAYGEDFDFAIEIWSADGAHLEYSQSRIEFPPLARGGHASVRTPDGAWRTYTLHQGRVTVRVGQSMAVRDRLAAKAALRTLTPFLLLVPLLAALVWFAVTRGLKPLDALAEAVRSRSSVSLQPIEARSAPREVQPVVASLNDLLARLTRALELQRAFVADAAHALRTPLTALHLQIQLAERAADASERAAAFGAVKEGVERTTHLVEQLLTLARNEPEAGARRVEQVDLGALAAEVVAAHAQLAETRGLDLGLARRDPDLTVEGEEEALRTLLSNLIDNALRYTPAGGKVDVCVRRTPEGALAEVVDTGPGIPPHERERVFDRFYRATSDVRGSGLGLAIVKSIATRHGGSVRLETGPHGRGLAVRVLIPAQAKVTDDKGVTRSGDDKR